MSSQREPSEARVEIAIAVVEQDGRYLIGLRPAGVPLAGYWEFPGGKVERGETVEQAAVRECLEETGLLVRVVGQYAPANQDYAHARVRLHFLACRVVESRHELPARWQWAPVAELGRYQFPPANSALLEQLGRTAR